MSNSFWFSFICILIVIPSTCNAILFSLFLCFSLHLLGVLCKAVSCAVRQSSSGRGPESSRWATRAQQGSSTAHQLCTVWLYSTLISRGLGVSFFPCLSFSFSVCLILCLLNGDRQKNTQRSSEGRASVPDSQFVLVLLCFTVQAYIRKQPRSSCFQNGLQDAFFSTYKHTQTHIHVRTQISPNLSQDAHILYARKQKFPSLSFCLMLPYQGVR